MTVDTRHCWIYARRQGQQVVVCDRCERVIRGCPPEHELPEFGCPGSLHERMNREQAR